MCNNEKDTKDPHLTTEVVSQIKDASLIQLKKWILVNLSLNQPTLNQQKKKQQPKDNQLVEAKETKEDSLREPKQTTQQSRLEHYEIPFLKKQNKQTTSLNTQQSLEENSN